MRDRIVSIDPGGSWPGVKTLLSPMPEEQVDRLPTGYLGRPAGIAASIAQRFSDDARCITGQVLAVDGGWCIA